VRPGTYSGQLTINKPLELVGEGDRDVIVIEATDETFLPNFVPSLSQYAVVRVCATGVHLSNLSVRLKSRSVWLSPGKDDADSILVEGGGELRMDGCDITSSVTGNSGVWVKSGKVTLLHNHIHDCGFSGVVLEGTLAKAALEDNAIDNCGAWQDIGGGRLPAIHVKDGAVVTARGNRITNNGGFGVRVEGRGKGEFQENDLQGNKKGAWDIQKDSLLNVLRLGNRE
jgi:parallel beta-helix repeat protein